jgi:hypothetical protein
MARPLTILLGLALALPLLTAAPVPTHLMPEPVYYFPTTVGTKWVYQEGIRQRTEVVTEVEGKGATKVVFVGLEEKGKVLPWVNVEVSRRGLFRVWCRGNKDDPPHPWLKLPVEGGGEWAYDDIGLGGRILGKVRATASGPEEVEVPAGTYRAIRVEMSWPARGGLGDWAPSTSTRWYAPGVGLVKQTGPSYEEVLKSFAPGR